jgi:hypothetical protein
VKEKLWHEIGQENNIVFTVDRGKIDLHENII